MVPCGTQVRYYHNKPKKRKWFQFERFFQLKFLQSLLLKSVNIFGPVDLDLASSIILYVRTTSTENSKTIVVTTTPECEIFVSLYIHVTIYHVSFLAYLGFLDEFSQRIHFVPQSSRMFQFFCVSFKAFILHTALIQDKDINAFKKNGIINVSLTCLVGVQS